MNITHGNRTLVAAAIVVLAVSGSATAQAAESDPVPQRPATAPLDRAGAILHNDNDPRGHHGQASISGATGMPAQTSESLNAVGATPPRVNDDDPRGHHGLPSITGADGFGEPASPLVSDDDPRGHHMLPRIRR